VAASRLPAEPGPIPRGVNLSQEVAKDLSLGRAEILRCAQDDSSAKDLSLRRAEILRCAQDDSSAKDLSLGRAEILRCAQDDSGAKDDSSAYGLAGFTPGGGYC